MKINRAFLFSVFSLFLLLISCGDFNKIQKSSDDNFKYTKAKEYYDKGDFYHAMMLFEELIPQFKGRQEEEEIYYYYAYCNYNQGDFSLAGYHFKNFVRTFPQSRHSEECSFMSAFCYYHNSPNYSLDQSDTKTALSELQAFINDYPSSTRIDSATILVTKLRAKLEKKYYEIAKQYYQINDYKAAITACNIYVKDYPDAPYVEEINYLNIKANYLLAVNSIEIKKLERLNAAIGTYQKFVDLYPQSKFMSEVENIYKSCKQMKENLLKAE